MLLIKMWSKPPFRWEVPLRVSRSLAALALVSALLMPALGLAGPPTEPKTVAELVPVVQATYKSVQTIRAEFVQTSKNPMTGVEEKQKGKILLERPRKYRLELGLPLTSAVVGDGATQWIYAAQAKQVTVQKELGTGGGPVQLIDDLGRLTELFDATLAAGTVPPKPIFQLTLKPKVPGSLVQMDVTLKEMSYVLQELNLTYSGGVGVKMAFTGMILGGDIPDTQFMFKAPPGVTVVQM